MTTMTTTTMTTMATARRAMGYDDNVLVDRVKHVLRLGLSHVAVSNQRRGELAAKRELEVLGLGLLGRGSKFIARLFGVIFALLERSSLFAFVHLSWS